MAYPEHVTQRLFLELIPLDSKTAHVYDNCHMSTIAILLSIIASTVFLFQHWAIPYQIYYIHLPSSIFFCRFRYIVSKMDVSKMECQFQLLLIHWELLQEFPHFGLLSILALNHIKCLQFDKNMIKVFIKLQTHAVLILLIYSSHIKYIFTARILMYILAWILLKIYENNSW